MRYGPIPLAAAAFASIAAAPPPPSLGDALVANRHSLTLANGQMGGDGAAVIAEAVAAAPIVALGEDHITNEVPALAAALCNLMAPSLSAMVLEVGPTALAEIAPMMKRRDRLAQMAAFNARYPNAVAFLDTRADNDAAAHCATVARDPAFRLVGIDQEFLGSGSLIIDRILATPLSPTARRAILALKADDRAAALAARNSGDPSALTTLHIGEQRIATINAALAKGGNAKARTLFAGLADSYRIYAKNSAAAWDSNLVRSQLMKRQFTAQAPTHGKMLMKFGDFHLYKGISPRGIRDIGNMVAELSEARGQHSLHIAFLGAKGVHSSFAGFGRPLGREPFVMTDDPDYPWLKLAIDRMAGNGWTLFDFRPLRNRRLSDVSAPWQKMIDGYDLLILAPVFTPSDLIR